MCDSLGSMPGPSRDREWDKPRLGGRLDRLPGTAFGLKGRQSIVSRPALAVDPELVLQPSR
jgi:hypothetical protein